jgi:hypothetical protein
MTIVWIALGFYCIIVLIFAISLGKAAKKGDEAIEKALTYERSRVTITSGCPVENNKE